MSSESISELLFSEDYIEKRAIKRRIQKRKELGFYVLLSVHKIIFETSSNYLYKGINILKIFGGK